MIKPREVTNLLAGLFLSNLFFSTCFSTCSKFITPTGNVFTSEYWYFWKSIKSKCKVTEDTFLEFAYFKIYSKQRKLHEKEVEQFFRNLIYCSVCFGKVLFRLIYRCYRKDYEPLIIWITLAVFLIVNFELKMLRT